MKPVKPPKTEGNGKSAKSKYIIVAIYRTSSAQQILISYTHCHSRRQVVSHHQDGLPERWERSVLDQAPGHCLPGLTNCHQPLFFVIQVTNARSISNLARVCARVGVVRPGNGWWRMDDGLASPSRQGRSLDDTVPGQSSRQPRFVQRVCPLEDVFSWACVCVVADVV